jgi:DNA-3-methyladenine glycosylase II
MKKQFEKERALLMVKDKTLAKLFSEIEFDFIRRSAEPYHALVRAIAHQMVHGNAAKACLRRLCEACGGEENKALLVPAAANVVACGPNGIRACGFSGAKSQAIFELAERTIAGTIPDTKKLSKMTDAEVIKTLVPLRGVGKWTVEMYLIFSLGRMDVFPVDDFGVREGYRIWKREKAQRKPADLALRARKWAPYRSVVALALWKRADAHKKIAPESKKK